MRIDRFLKVSRIIIRRTIAKEACEQERVKINGKIAKAGDRVEVGDIIEIQFGSGVFMAKVLELKDHVKKNEAGTLYEVIENEEN